MPLSFRACRAPNDRPVAYSFIDLLGPSWIDGHEVEAQAVLGSRIKLRGDWQLDVSVGQNTARMTDSSATGPTSAR